VNLEDVRRGARGPEYAPDLGATHKHESAGAIVVGARPFLIAFNVVLRSDDITVARQIARTIRARNGGLPFVKALGFRLHTRGLVQVSMNLVNYEVTGMTAAYDAIHREADQLGVEIEGTEIVGLVPQNAVDPTVDIPETKILEHQIRLCQSV
jgi:glutamate formiminotransferase/glutamate formiminotransferase/formiminotetrahydrofolate cyclodeaminase